MATLLAALLTERQVFMFSSQVSLLTAVAETLRALLLPFTWQHVYVPVLPPKLNGVLQAPLPFLVGRYRRGAAADELSGKWNEDLQLSEAVVRVDLDRNYVHVSPNHPVRLLPAGQLARLMARLASTPAAPCIHERKWPAWRAHILPVLDLAVKPPARPAEVDESTAAEHPATDASHASRQPGDWEAVRSAFFRCFVSLFANYRSFVERSTASVSASAPRGAPGTSAGPLLPPLKPRLHALFKREDFLATKSLAEVEFLAPFLDTLMFRTLLDETVCPARGRGSNPVLLFFEERIEQRNNRRASVRLWLTGKIETPFLDDKGFAVHKTVVAPRPPEVHEMQPGIVSAAHLRPAASLSRDCCFFFR